MDTKKCENCKWWQGELREYDGLGKFRICREGGSIISSNSNDSCNKFELNGVQLPYIKKKIEKTKLKKTPVMDTKNGIKLYIASVNKRTDTLLESEISRTKIFQKDVKEIKKRKPLAKSDKLAIQYSSKEIKKSMAKIVVMKKQKKLTLKIIKDSLVKLRKHPNIIGVETGKDGLQVYTKPLEVEKKEIGHYEINFSYKSLGRIRINNLDKRRSGDHWFVEDGIPCFGEWRKGINEYAYSGNIYLVIDLLIRFLTSNYRSKEGYITFDNFIKDYS